MHHLIPILNNFSNILYLSMKKAILIFLLGTISICGIYAQKTYNEFVRDLNGDFEPWVKERVQTARKGIKEKIIMPLVVRSTGWGCRCPEHYIGVGTKVKEGPYIFPVTKLKIPKINESGYSLVVKGYFNGKLKHLDLRQSEDEPEEWDYYIPEFVITEWEINKKGDEVEAPRVVVAY